MGCLSQTARWLGDQLRGSEHFELISDGSAIPVVGFRLKGDPGYTEFDVSHALRAFGWQVPAYTMPENADRHRRAAHRCARRILDGPGAGIARRHASRRSSNLDKLKPDGHFDELQPFAH